MTRQGTDAILFDVDGTLVDSTFHHALAWHRAFRGRGLTLPMVDIHRAIGMGGDKIVAHLSDAATEDRIGDALRDAWREEYAVLRDEVGPLPGAAELVRRVAHDGYRVALASSGDPQFSREAVDLLGVGDIVELLTTAEDVDRSKPHPDLITTTLGLLDGVERAVLVGDTVWDVESAARAGLPCVGVLTGGVGREELTSAGAAHVVGTPGDLVDLEWDGVLARTGRT